MNKGEESDQHKSGADVSPPRSANRQSPWRFLLAYINTLTTCLRGRFWCVLHVWCTDTIGGSKKLYRSNHAEYGIYTHILKGCARTYTRATTYIRCGEHTSAWASHGRQRLGRPHRGWRHFTHKTGIVSHVGRRRSSSWPPRAIPPDAPRGEGFLCTPGVPRCQCVQIQRAHTNISFSKCNIVKMKRPVSDFEGQIWSANNGRTTLIHTVKIKITKNKEY